MRYVQQSYQQWNVRDDHSAVLVNGELWYKLQDLVVLKGNSPVFMKFDVDFLHIFSGNETNTSCLTYFTAT